MASSDPRIMSCSTDPMVSSAIDLSAQVPGLVPSGMSSGGECHADAGHSLPGSQAISAPSLTIVQDDRLPQPQMPDRTDLAHLVKP